MVTTEQRIPGSLSEPGQSPRRQGRRPKLADAVATILEERILDGTLAAGDALPIEADLADELNVSRTVIRDAIRGLSARGLVTVRQGLRTVVTAPSLNDFAEAGLTLILRSDCTYGELVDAREILETEIPSAVIRSGAGDWREAEAALDNYERAVRNEQWDEAVSAHREFHIGVMTATHNPIMTLLTAPLSDIINTTNLPPTTGQANSSWAQNMPLHRPILEAAIKGDEKAYRKAVADHYAYTKLPSFDEQRPQKLRHSPIVRSALEYIRARPRPFPAAPPRLATD